jgi:hypothetical protein
MPYRSRSNWKHHTSGFVDAIDTEGMDPRQKKMAILVGALVLVLGVVMFFLYGPPSKSGSTTTTPTTKKTAPTVTKVVSAWPTPEPYPVTLRDPMSYEFPDDTPPEPEPKDPGPVEVDPGPVVVTPTLPDLEVTAIMQSDSGNLAMVNGFLLGEGEVVSGAKVVSIEAERVVFELEGIRWVKELKQE